MRPKKCKKGIVSILFFRSWLRRDYRAPTVVVAVVAGVVVAVAAVGVAVVAVGVAVVLVVVVVGTRTGVAAAVVVAAVVVAAVVVAAALPWSSPCPDFSAWPLAEPLSWLDEPDLDERELPELELPWDSPCEPPLELPCEPPLEPPWPPPSLAMACMGLTRARVAMSAKARVEICLFTMISLVG